MNWSNFQVFYTNMDYRPDRKSYVLDELKKIGIDNPIRESGVVFAGTENNQWNGWIGCGLCHLNILKKADPKKHLLIFEDDVQFINDYNNVLDWAYNELPIDWKMWYLGANVCRPITRFSDHLGRLSHAQSTHSYAVHKDFIQQLVHLYEPVSQYKIIDVFYADEIVPNYSAYITNPMIAVQREGKSDIENKQVKYIDWMQERFYNNLRS